VDIRRPAVRAEDDYTYTDKSSGRQLSFTPKPDEAMVTFQGSPSESDVNEVIRVTPLLSVSQGFNLERGFAAVHISPDQDMEAVTRSVEDQPATANSLPVMIDRDGLTRYFLPDEFTVQFREGVSKEQAEEIIRQQGSHVIAEQRTPGYYTLAVPEGRGLFETIREFSDLEEVAFAEPSEAGFNDALQQYIPDDPDFAQLWGMHNTGQTVNGTTGTADADIDAPEAWNLARGAPDVIVAVIDTGADLDHPDLQARFLPRGAEDWDFADPNDPIPDDLDSHGSHVGGTVAAADNTVGVIGVAPECRLMPLRIDLTAGMNQNRADAINYVATQATASPLARFVINCSWRMSGDHTGVRTAIQNAVNRNVVVVFAAGNDNRNTDITPQFPGVYPEVIAVAALDQRDQKAGFSNFGNNVDVSAPGVNIRSTIPNNTYGFNNGTSMASPHVAGLAALIWSVKRDLTNDEVRQVIEDTCDDIDAANPGFVGMLGQGRINAFRAVSSLAAPLDIGTVIHLQCLGNLPGPRFLDGVTQNGTVVLSPHNNAPFTGTRWKVGDGGGGTITLECQGHLPGNRFLDGRTANGTVGLAPHTNAPFTGTKWRVVNVRGATALECQGHLPGNRFLDGRTANGTVGLAPSTDGVFTGARWFVTR
jgi:subtilisin family serine protease